MAINADSYNGFVYALTDGKNRIIYAEQIFCNYFMDLDYDEYIPHEYLLDGFDASSDNPYALARRKEINSCFGNKELVEYLDKQKVKALMIVGLQTNFCIDASVKSAFERGYRVIIPKGTNSTVDNDYMDAETTYKYYNEMMWPNRFADCVSLDEAIGMMERL